MGTIQITNNLLYKFFLENGWCNKKMNKTDLIGNITTLIKLVSMILAGYTIGILTSHGLQLPVTESQLTEAISTILFIILAYFDAKYPNNLIEKATPTQTTIEVTTDTLADAIQKASNNEEEEIIVEQEVIGDDQQ